jgi:hypothetical protein
MNSSISYDRWAKLTILEQMGNIGSEVGRAISSERRGDVVSRDGAIGRALDLFAATAKFLAGEKSLRLREVLRSRDQFLGLFFDDNFDDADAVESYFMQFAIAARSGR